MYSTSILLYCLFYVCIFTCLSTCLSVYLHTRPTQHFRNQNDDFVSKSSMSWHKIIKQQERSRLDVSSAETSLAAT